MKKYKHILIFSFLFILVISGYAQTTIFADDFSTDLSWTGYGSGGWARGSASSSTGCSGSQDPSADHSSTADNNIIGNVLGGCYANSLSSTYYITSPVIDCTNFTDVELDFWSWSGCEGSSYDHVYVEVYDGSTWHIIWQNGASASESAWTLWNFDVSAYADGNANFQVRFGMGTTDSSATYCGWNIDDFEVKGTAPVPYNMTNGSVTACSGVFYDPEGTSGYIDLPSGSIITETFCSGSSDLLRFNFTVFVTDESADNLKIYDGPNVSSTLLGTYSESTGPGIILSTGNCLTFVWDTDTNHDGEAGWEATISCIPPPCPTTIASFPHTESFETDLGDWTQSSTDAYDWTRDDAGTPSTTTGPSTGSDGSYYLYTEATSQTNSEFSLLSPCYDLTSCATPNFYFDYHMYGADMGSLTLEVEITPGSGTWTTLWTKSGDQGNVWHSGYVNLIAYTGTTIKLRFKAITGVGGYSDIAIDNLSFTCSPPPVCPTTISSFPHTESFETDLGDWTQSSLLIIDDYDWTRDDAGTPSSPTGPATGSDGSYYLYTEATSQQTRLL